MEVRVVFVREFDEIRQRRYSTTPETASEFKKLSSIQETQLKRLTESTPAFTSPPELNESRPTKLSSLWCP